jgi:hypothetical protein
MSAVMWRCGKCNALIIEGVPSHVISMQERIAELEADRNAWRESAETLGREVAALREQVGQIHNIAATLVDDGRPAGIFWVDVAAQALFDIRQIAAGEG